jgi:hypothetical protein
MEEKQLQQFTFYDLYAILLDTLSDEERGVMVRRMCGYIFGESTQEELTDKKLIFLWDNIVDYLDVDKKALVNDRTPKGLNRKMKHFTFYKTFYEAINIMDNKQIGQYTKAIYNFMLNGVEPVKLVSPVDLYYMLAKKKLEVSKIRSNVGKKGGKAERVRLTNEDINKATQSTLISFEMFMEEHPNIKNDLYASQKHLLNGIDWGFMDMGIERHPRYKNCASLYQLVTHYNEIKSGI